MKNINIELITDIYKYFKPRTIYLVGSSILCDNPNDIDICLVYETDKEVRANKKSLLENEPESLKTARIQEHYNLSFSSKEKAEFIMSFFMYEGGDYYKYLYGDETFIDKNTINVFTNKAFRKSVISIMFDQINNLKQFGLSGSYTIKPYRLLMSCYMLNNGNYILTDEQISILNKVHDDKNISDELFSYCETTIKNIALSEH